MKTHLKSLLYMFIVGVLFWLFLPEKYTINVPFQFTNSLNEQEMVERLTVAEGYSISIYADQIDGVRAIISTDTGDIIASRPNSGKLVLILNDANNDGRSDGNKLLLKGLNKPHGIALHEGWLYIAETNAVLRIQYNAKQRKFIGTPHYIIQDSFPGGGNHWSRSVKIGPDNNLYVSIGSSCNVCIETSTKRASILQYDLDGKNERLFASGLRNTVGFDWSPVTQRLFGVDNGRDFLGENLPFEELNHIIKGHHYGWPFTHDDKLHDPDFFAQKPPPLITDSPVHKFIAHSAPLSLMFLRHAPQTALVTLHGSWNRSKKSGYKVVSLTFSSNNHIHENDFISGFERNGSVIGRPVDLTQDKQGNIYLSDDYSGKIYKINPRENAN